MANTYKEVNASTGSGSSGGGGTGSVYFVNFVTGDWVLSGAFYSFTVLEADHGKGINPGVQSFLDNGVDHELTETDVHINSSGDVELRVTSSPDNRFNGRIVILE